MSLRGVRQLKELIIRYSDYDGSSKGIREWMRLNLITFATNNPEINIKAERKRCCHPILYGNYMNGNMKQVCIKNLELDEITRYVLFLRNQIGRKMSSTGYNKPLLSQRPSIQGEWNELMDLVDLKLEIEMKE